MKSIFLNKKVVAFLMLLFTSGAMFSQDYDKEVHRKFIQLDSNGVNNDALLILYADNTYVNFGIMNDPIDKEMYIWYAYGQWTQKGTEVSCKTYYNAYNQQKTIDGIKFYYRFRPNYRLIDSYFEFVCERYVNNTFLVILDKAIDLSKKIEYTEVRINTANNQLK
jgi:hypothetical protein